MREATQGAGAKVEDGAHPQEHGVLGPAVRQVPFPRLLPGGHTGGIWPLRCLGPRVFLKTREHELHGPSRGVQEKSRCPPPPACGPSADSGHPSPPSAKTGARWRDPPRTSVVRTRLRRHQPGSRVVAAGGEVPGISGCGFRAFQAPATRLCRAVPRRPWRGPTTRADVPRATCPHRHVAIGRGVVPTPVRGRVRVDAVLRRGCLWSCTSPTTSLAEAKRKQEK